MSAAGGENRGDLKSADGLHAGWAILLFVVITLALALTLFGMVYWLAHWTPADLAGIRTRPRPGVTTAQEVAATCSSLIAYAAMCRIDRSSWREYGLDLAHSGSSFVKGALSGALLMSLLVARSEEH